MSQLEVTIPSWTAWGVYPDYSRPWWSLDYLDDSELLTAYPVSGDDIARWRAENG